MLLPSGIAGQRKQLYIAAALLTTLSLANLFGANKRIHVLNS